MRHHPLERRAVATALVFFTFNAVVFTHTAIAADTATTPAPKVTAMAAARFLEQAGFGPTAASIAEVQSLGFSAWIDAQMAIPSSKWSVIPEFSTDAKGNTSLAPTQQGFFVNAVSGDDQLRQKVALALSEIWVVSDVKLRADAMVPYLKMLQADAFTTFDKLLYDVTVSPAMGHYLDMVNNNKGASPNENYAREVLQLFSIGLSKLDAYGRVMKDSTGTAIPTYSQDQIEGFASVFTGWTYAPLPGATKSHFGNPANWNAPMVPFEANHDMNPKVLLNGYITPANQTAETDLKDALNNIATHPNVGPFICRQLIQRLVSSNPSDNYVKRISSVFLADSRNIGAAVKAILLDPEARQGDNGKENAATKLREPILWISAILRGLNAKVVAPNNLVGNANVLGQDIYYSPTVFNYFHPGYEITTSPTQQSNAPEFELLSEATAASAADLVNTLVYGTVTGVTIDLTPYITPLGAKPTAAQIKTLVDSLNSALMGGRMPAAMEATIIKAVTAQTTPKAMVQTAVYLIGSSWNYQVER